jgi:hypothetical protein
MGRKYYKKFWEELSAYFHWYDADLMENKKWDDTQTQREW